MLGQESRAVSRPSGPTVPVIPGWQIVGICDVTRVMAESDAKSKKSGAPLVNVICMKWGTKYGPEYVNRLYHGVSRHLKRPHRFVCFTEDATGIEPGVEIFPLPELNLPPSPERGWLKLATFGPTLADLEGQTLFLDVDLVIVGELDIFFEPPGPFYIMRDFKRPGSKVGNSSVYRFTIGDHTPVLDSFLADFEGAKKRHRNEQEYLTQAMEDLGELDYWPPDWAVSYKKRCIPPFPLNYFISPRCPDDTRIVVFHGRPKPEEAIEGSGNKWYRFAKAAPWIGDAWHIGEKSK